MIIIIRYHRLDTAREKGNHGHGTATYDWILVGPSFSI
jgi:hypothetical protein